MTSRSTARTGPSGRGVRALVASLGASCLLAVGLAVPAHAADSADAGTPASQASPSTAPSAVTDLAATLEDGVMTVTWGPATANGEPITGYTVAVRPSTRTLELGPDARSATFTGLQRNTRYSVYVVATTAVHGADAIPPGTEEVIPVLQPQQGFHNLVRRGRSIQLDWTAFAERGAAVTGYEVGGLPGGPRLLGPDARSIAADLEWGQTYAVTLRALTATGASAPVRYPVSVPVLKPTSPKDLTARSVKRRIIVTWSPSEARGTPVTGYRVRMQPTGRTVIVGADKTRAVIRGVRPGVQHRITVTALSAVTVRG